ACPAPAAGAPGAGASPGPGPCPAPGRSRPPRSPTAMAGTGDRTGRWTFPPDHPESPSVRKKWLRSTSWCDPPFKQIGFELPAAAVEAGLHGPGRQMAPDRNLAHAVGMPVAAHEDILIPVRQRTEKLVEQAAQLRPLHGGLGVAGD